MFFEGGERLRYLLTGMGKLTVLIINHHVM